MLTSNRDEQVQRATALIPAKYLVNNQEIIFPKDPKGGGTWFAVHPKREAVIVLLNGAEEAHIPNPPYRKSRGQIVLELLTEPNSLVAWQTIDLQKIEPFTIVLFEDENLTQLRWNGLEKTEQPLSVEERHIWSSSTLYQKNVREERQQWFQNFVAKGDLSANSILNFHQFTQNDDAENGLQINRNGIMQTLSICQVVLNTKEIKLTYVDLLAQETSELNVVKV